MDNFYDTANRMYKSSKILHQAQEYHNACYLAGYVLECYAKIIVSIFGTNPPRSFGHNISNLDTELQNILGRDSSLSSYILNGSSDFAQILSKWNPVNLRYIASSNTLVEQDSTNFQTEIEFAMEKLTQIQIAYTL